MKTNDLFADVGFGSINHYGEQLCGDHVELVQKGKAQEDNTKIIVLADGLGSGVKASILSILTSKIISTMLASDLKFEDAVETIVQALPVCSERGSAFSTFTVLRIDGNNHAELMQYQNPRVIMLRDGKNHEIPYSTVTIGDKEIMHSEIKLRENDLFFLMSDGVLYASETGVYNDDWDRDHVISYMETFFNIGFTAKTLTTILLEETNRLYGGKPTDDATVCTVRIRRRESVNVAFGPPTSFDDNKKMMGLFFAREGRHIVCGGTTAKIAAEYLGQPVITTDSGGTSDIPPLSKIEGCDLVSEGILTMNRVLDYAKDYLEGNASFESWSYKKDAASLIARMLFETATDVNLFIGRAVNPAHQNMAFNFEVKMRLVTELADCLTKMGKIVLVNYF